MSFANSSVTMNGLGTMNIASGANIYLKDTSLTINGGTLQGADVTPLIVFGGVSHLNIGGTVYLETVENGVILNADSNTGETNISVSDGSIFYINSNAGEANVSLYSAYVNTIVNTIKTNSNISSLGFNNMNQDYNAIIIYNDYLQYNDNADALSNGVALGSVYKTPDGVLHQVMASVPAKIYKVVFDLVTTGYNALSGGDPLTGVTIVYSDYTGVLGLNPLKYQNNFDGIRVGIKSGLTIVDANVLFTFDTNQHFVPYVTRPASNIIDIIQTEDFVQQSIIEGTYPTMTITIQFLA